MFAFALSLLAALCLVLPAWAASAAEVVHFSPEGTVKEVRQVTARFSEPMVPLGDPRETVAPFDADCAPPGRARWIDSRTWALDFDTDLPAGVACRFTLRDGLTALSGAPVTGRRAFAFSTGGPAVRVSRPFDGHESIDEEQAFVLGLDAEATEASVLANVTFAVQGVPERIGVRLVEGAAREALLEAIGRSLGDRPAVVLQARRRFPSGAVVRLVWGTGVAARSGVATDRDQVLTFRVRRAFTAEFTCERENARAACIPIAPMALRFSAPVAADLVRKVTLVGQDGRRHAPALSEEATSLEEATFEGPFPEAARFRIEVPAGLVDDAGRPLANASRFPLAVATAEYPPLARFPARFGIVEARGDRAVPLTLRNLEPQVEARLLKVDRDAADGLVGRAQEWLGRVTGRVQRLSPSRPGEMLEWLRRVGNQPRTASVFGHGGAAKAFAIPKPNGARAFEVIGVPLPGPGLYVLEVESARLGASLLGRGSMYVPTAVLVTNLAVHLKWGREGSLVWVTALDTGRPVAGADVTVHDCRGAAVASGQTDAQGILRIARLPGARALPSCQPPRVEWDVYEYSPALADLDGGLLALAQVGDDVGLAHSSWADGIEPWRFGLPSEPWTGPVVVHTILDRPLFRAGETVHMKHLLRQRTLRGFAAVPPAERPARLEVRHQGSDERHDLPLAWDAAGVAEHAWAIPREAKLGTYEVVAIRPEKGRAAAGSEEGYADGGGREWVAATFRVEEFRVPLLRGTVGLPAGPLVAPAEVPADLAVRYLAGGGAADLPVTVRAQVRPGGLPAFEAFEDFTFAAGPVPEGIVRRAMGEAWEEGEDGDVLASGRPQLLAAQSATLDRAGTARAVVRDLPRLARPAQLLVEAEYRDPNGEVQTAASTVPLWPARRLVGLKPDGWVASKDRLAAAVAVVDTAGRPAAGVAVTVGTLVRKRYTHRKRLVGGFYGYEQVLETKRLGVLCRGTTDRLGRLACEGKPPATGNLVLEARAAGAVATHRDVWVAGGDEWWFDLEDGDRMDVLPERRRYEPGETARLQVRMPFREATALVTLEREGVLEARVVPLSGRAPVVEVPITEGLAPNMFVSVLAVRGRVGEPKPTATVDLARPAFRLGVAELQVGWRAHELSVSVSTDRPAYRVRETVRAKVSVRTAAGQAPPAGAEVAIAAVDEGLLELAPNDSWRLLEAMMTRRGHGVATSTATLQVVGKRHYGLKALPVGGGGGRQATRELFDTLLFWRGRVALDAKGEATVDVPLGDALTSVRIVAVATAGIGRFGTGRAAVRATQDLMVLPGLAPLVREGDRVRAEVTVRNAAARAMTVAVRGEVEGLAPLAAQTVALDPGAARTLEWDVAVPAGVLRLRYEVVAEERGGVTDRVRVVQSVRPATPVRTTQATLARADVRMPVARPADALPGRGGVRVALAASLVSGLDGVAEWMRAYPYTCLEQRVSRAVVLEDPVLRARVEAAFASHQDGDGLLMYFPTSRWGSEVLTAYVLAVAHEAGWDLPEGVRERALEGLAGFVEGRVVRWPTLAVADLAIRKVAALEALSRYGRAEPRLAGSLALEPNLWPTSAVLDWWAVLTRVEGIPNRAARLLEAERILRARLDLSGTTLAFSSEGQDHFWWLMASPDANAARLVLLLTETRGSADDLPRLVLGALARQRRGAWDTTVSNAWGSLAVRRFARTYEKDPVGGTTSVSLAGETRPVGWGAPPAPVDLPWPAGAGEVTVSHAGTGKPWVTVQTRAAIPLAAPLEAGYRVTKTVTPVAPQRPGRLGRGDRLRVRLEIEAQRDMTWVVVNDPVPAGASHLGAADHPRLASLAFEERGFEAYRAYYEFLPKGRHVVEYTVRVNQAGRFGLPPTRVEALYAPEVFGESPNAAVEVEP